MKKYNIYYEGQLVDSMIANSPREALTDLENMLEISIDGWNTFDVVEAKQNIFGKLKNIFLSLTILSTKKELKSVPDEPYEMQRDMKDDIKECQFCGELKESSPTPDGDEICPNCGDLEMMDKEHDCHASPEDGCDGCIKHN